MNKSVVVGFCYLRAMCKALFSRASSLLFLEMEIFSCISLCVPEFSSTLVSQTGRLSFAKYYS